MELYITGVLVWSFFCFTFVAEQMNPFVKPSTYIKRAQWRYGRRVCAASLGFGAIFLLLLQFTPISLFVALVTCAVLFAMSWIMILRHMQAKGEL